MGIPIIKTLLAVGIPKKKILIPLVKGIEGMGIPRKITQFALKGIEGMEIPKNNEGVAGNSQFF